MANEVDAHSLPEFIKYDKSKIEDIVRIFMEEEIKEAMDPAVYRLIALWRFLQPDESKKNEHGILPTASPKEARQIMSDLLDKETGFADKADLLTLYKKVFLPLFGDEELSAMHRLQILIRAYLRAITSKKFIESEYYLATNAILYNPDVYTFDESVEHGPKHTFHPDVFVGHFLYFVKLHQTDPMTFPVTAQPSQQSTPVVAPV